MSETFIGAPPSESTATDRNVYILGAGFSAAAGAPVVRDFLDRAREILDDPDSDLNDYERDAFKEVFAFKRRVAQAREKVVIDLDDIEQLFGMVEMSCRLGKAPYSLRDSTVYLIAKTLQLATARGLQSRPHLNFLSNKEMLAGVGGELPIGFSPVLWSSSEGEKQFRVDIYTYFGALIAGLLDDRTKRKARTDTVITFNYDLVCDHALERIGVKPNYHLPEELTGLVPEPAPGCSVLKLHGSTNWGICRCKKSIVVLPEKVTDHPDELRTMICPKCGGRQYQPLLVPPSWDKNEYREVMESVWKRAIQELSTATRICIIGYSMPETDAYFKYLLTLGLSENPGLYRLIVVDFVGQPVSETEQSTPFLGVEERYVKLLDELFRKRRFAFHSRGVERFLAESGHYHLGRGEMVRGNFSFS